MWRWRGGAARRALRQRTLQSDCSHRKTRPFGILESSCGRCGLVESPQPPERNTKTLPTLYPYPIFSSLRRSPRVRRTSTGAKSRAVGSAGINAGCPSGWAGGKISRASGRGGRRHQVADPQKRETDSASVAGEIFSPAPAAPAGRQGLCPFELCPRNVANILSQNARGNV